MWEYKEEYKKSLTSIHLKNFRVQCKKGRDSRFREVKGKNRISLIWLQTGGPTVVYTMVLLKTKEKGWAEQIGNLERIK